MAYDLLPIETACVPTAVTNNWREAYGEGVQIVAHGLGLPLCRVQEALTTKRPALADGFRELLAIFGFHAPEQTYEVAPDPVPSLRASEAVRYASVQLLKRLRSIFSH